MCEREREGASPCTLPGVYVCIVYVCRPTSPYRSEHYTTRSSLSLSLSLPPAEEAVARVRVCVCKVRRLPSPPSLTTYTHTLRPYYDKVGLDCCCMQLPATTTTGGIGECSSFAQAGPSLSLSLSHSALAADMESGKRRRRADVCSTTATYTHTRV